MHFRKLRTYSQWWRNAILVVMLLFCVSCSLSTQTSATQQRTTPTVKPPLPGQQIWRRGVSSFLFGTNDTQEWSNNNVEVSPDIQLALKNAHFTLMRTFFFDKSLADGHATTDAEIETRIKAVENSGMICLGVLQNVNNVDFAKHVVAYLGKRCNLYEFGNEPDYNGISVGNYLNQWDKVIPMLRAINPQAKFIGPVDGPATSDFLRAYLLGVKAANILPDAVSFHWYPCDQDTQGNCLDKASSIEEQALGVRALVRNILGKELPVGVTEWNYDPGNPPPSYGDDPKFIRQFTNIAIQSMIKAGVAFACQFDAASYSGYGRLDMFNTDNNEAKAQYFALKDLIALYRPAQAVTTTSTSSPLAGGNGALISRDKPTYCSHNDGSGGTQVIVDGHYGNGNFWTAKQSRLPSWCAIYVGAQAARLLVVWSSDYVFNYISDGGSAPQDYTLSVSSDSTDGSDGTWHTVVNVTDNHARAREHLLDFQGQSWIKMTVTKVQVGVSSQDFGIDEIDLYDVSTSSNLNDTFFFSGASITTIAFNRFDEHQPSFDEDVHRAYPQLFPVMIDGGMGGWSSSDALTGIDLWLTLNPDMHYWLLGWGTNDAMDHASPEQYRANLQILIDKIKQAGHVPILGRLTYAHVAGKNEGPLDQEIQSLNAVIDQLTVENGLIRGPDFYQLFREHWQTYLDTDGIHPSPAGAIAMNEAWFEALRPYLNK